MMNIEKLKFPIGTYIIPEHITDAHLSDWMNDIKRFPGKIEEITRQLDTSQLLWKYRPNGWTIAQVVHHCADSHINAFTRFKLALTENKPTIRPYYEAEWAELPVAKSTDLSDSITLLIGLHASWVKLLQGLSPDQFNQKYIHPEHGKEYTLAETVGNYAWHCNHHLAHIKQGIKHEGEFN